MTEQEKLQEIRFVIVAGMEHYSPNKDRSNDICIYCSQEDPMYDESIGKNNHKHNCPGVVALELLMSMQSKSG